MLVLDGHIEHRHHHACHKERPAEQGKQFHSGPHPIQLEDLGSHISHHGKELRHRIIDGGVEPLEHGIPDHVGDLLTEETEHAANGIANPADEVT